MVMIESTEGLANLDDILAVDGIDVVQIGSSDLSSSMGFRGDLVGTAGAGGHRPRHRADAQAQVAVGVGSFAGFPPDRIRHYLASGAQFVNITTQTLLARRRPALEGTAGRGANWNVTSRVVNSLTPAHDIATPAPRRPARPAALRADRADRRCCCSPSGLSERSTRSGSR